MTTPAQIRAWLNDPSSGPDVYRRNWNGKCQALMWQICHRFGVAPVVYASADKARFATLVKGTNASEAPVGAFHYWKLGTYGHVALGLGGELVLMASTHVDEVWATAAGVVTVSRYNSRVAGETYVGWGLVNGANDVHIDSVAPAGGLNTTPLEDDMQADERAALLDIHAVIKAAYRRTHGRLIDRGDLDAAVKELKGAPHSDRNDYGRVADAGDVGQILAAIAAIPATGGTGGGFTAGQLEQILTAVAKVPAATLAEFGLKRA